MPMCVDVATHVRARTKKANVYSMVEAGQQREDPRPVHPRVPPDPPEEREVKTFATAFGQVGSRAAPIPDETLEHAPQARRAPEVEKEHRVGPLEPNVAVRDGQKVAIENPALAADRCREVAAVLLRGPPSPARLPQHDVEVDHR